MITNTNTLTEKIEDEAVTLVEVRFGRNIGGAPMPARRWSAFKKAHTDFFTWASKSLPEGYAWVELHQGKGSWGGGGEESAVATLYLTPAVSYLAPGIAADAIKLAKVTATRYEQDAVAVVFEGKSVLVSGEVTK